MMLPGFLSAFFCFGGVMLQKCEFLFLAILVLFVVAMMILFALV